MGVITVRCCITLHGSDREVTRCAISSVHVNDSEFGLPPDSAQWMSFRQAAYMLGLPISAAASSSGVGSINEVLKRARAYGKAPADVMALAKQLFDVKSLSDIKPDQCQKLLASLSS